MFDTLIHFYFDYFTNPKNDGWALISSSVCVSILSGLYVGFVENSEAIPMEELLIEEKQRYWDIAGKYYQDKEQRVKATKAAYALALITSTE